MAAGFGYSQGHQLTLGSLAVDVLFEVLDHLSVLDVLRFRQVCTPVSRKKENNKIIIKGFTHPVHRFVDILNGSHGTRPFGSGFSAASNSRCRIFLVLFRYSPLLKRSSSSAAQFPSIATGHDIHARWVSLWIRTTSHIISSLHPEVAMWSLPLKIYATTSMGSLYGT